MRKQAFESKLPSPVYAIVVCFAFLCTMGLCGSKIGKEAVGNEAVNRVY